MLWEANDIHKRYIAKKNGVSYLWLSEEYSYEFINIIDSSYSSLYHESNFPYFFVFAKELEEPFSVFVNIVPSNYLDPIQITRHPSIHFHYLSWSHFKKADSMVVKINDQTQIQYDDKLKQFTATIKNQIYSLSNYEEILLSMEHVKYDLFSIRKDSINSGFFLNKNFELQKNILDQKRILENNDFKENKFEYSREFPFKNSIIDYLQSELSQIILGYAQPITANIYSKLKNKKTSH